MKNFFTPRLFFLILLPFFVIFKPATGQALEDYVYDYTAADRKNRDDLKKATDELAKLEHSSFFQLRLGVNGGIAAHNDYLYGANDKLVGRANLNLAVGLLGIWPSSNNRGFGMGVMINQQLGAAIRPHNTINFNEMTITHGGNNFVGLTMVDFPFDFYFNAKVFFGMVIGLGVIYSDGGDTKTPLYFNDNFGAGAALAVKYGLELGFFFNKHVGLAFEIQYIYTHDSASYFDYGGYDDYGTTITYYNSGHNILPTVELLINF